MEPTLFDQQTDLLAQIDAIEINNTERISPEDKEFCELVQKCCHEALDQIQESHVQMMIASMPYIEEGIVKIRWEDTYQLVENEWNIKDIEEKFKNKHFIPCLHEKEIRIAFSETCRMFATTIIDHFNNKYGVNIDSSQLYREVPDITEFNPSFRPQYNDIVDMVIAHLGGRTFAQTMEDEVYENALQDYERKRLEIKGNSITIEHYAHSGYFDTELNYDTLRKIERLSEAIFLTFTGQKCHYGIHNLLGIRNDPRLGQTYECIIPEVTHFRFFKNNKMEIKFNSAASAQKIYDKLKTA